MAFLAPLAIKGGLMLGSSILGSKLAKSKPNTQTQDALNMTQQAQREQLAGGKNLLGLGTQAQQAPLNYWASLLSGNRGLATSAMAPEISRIGQGYQQAQQTSAALMPRGGPSASFLSQLPYQQQRDVSTLLQQARPQAAQQMGSLGQNLLSQGTSLLSGATSSGRSMLDAQEEMRKREAARGEKIGVGLFDLIQKYGLDTILGKLGKGGGGGGTGGGGSIFSDGIYPRLD